MITEDSDFLLASNEYDDLYKINLRSSQVVARFPKLQKFCQILTSSFDKKHIFYVDHMQFITKIRINTYQIFGRYKVLGDYVKNLSEVSNGKYL